MVNIFQFQRGQRWRRIIPMMMVTAVLIAMDHVILSFALPGISRGLAIGATLVGVIGGVLSLGSLMAHAPGGYWVSKWGPRKVVTLSLVAWSCVAFANSGVQNATQLVIVRFLLGVIEGAMTPALLVLLSHWFPMEERARANAYWMFCIPLAALILKPIVGWLLTLTTWRTLFLIEGIVPLLWVPCWWFCIADKPEQARWVGAEERDELARKFAYDALCEQRAPKSSWKSVIKDWRLWLLGIVSLLSALGARGMNFWLPVVLTGVTRQHIGKVGLIATLPSLAGMIGLYINSKHSDRSKERKHHAAIPHYLAALALFSAGILVLLNRNMSIACLVLAEGCMMAAGGVFWTLPTLLLGRQALGAGIGLIGAVGNIGGIVGPLLMGYVMSSREGVHGISLLMGVVALTQLLAGGIILSLRLESKEQRVQNEEKAKELHVQEV